MIKSQTHINSQSLKALTSYHLKRKGKNTGKKILPLILGIALLILSVINAYGYWLKYSATESIFYIAIRSSVLFILSFIILYSSQKSAEHHLYRELKQYFKRLGIDHIDYLLTDEGITMTINSKETFYSWNHIDHRDSDDTYYYFSIDGKHSLIEKSSISPKHQTRAAHMFKNI